MLGFSSVAVFVLASLQHVSRNGTEYDFYTKRLLPMAQTWGIAFETMYFVLGRTGRSRRVNPDVRCFRESNPAMLSSYAVNDQMELLNCDRGSELTQRQFNTIVFKNCSGMHQSSGMSCRSQELMRFYHKSSYFKDSRWLVILNDDVFVRPVAMHAMLQAKSTPEMETMPMAIVGNSKGIGFAQSKLFQQCDRSRRPLFNWAHPMIINRRAFETIVPTVLSNGLTQLQATWGVPNDAVLGSLLWLHSVPTYILGSQYVRTRPLDRDSIHEMKSAGSQNSNMSNYIIIHKVNNHFTARLGETQTQTSALFSFYNLLHMAEMMSSAINLTPSIKLSPWTEETTLGNLVANDLTHSHFSLQKEDLHRRFFRGHLKVSTLAVKRFNVTNCASES